MSLSYVRERERDDEYWWGVEVMFGWLFLFELLNWLSGVAINQVGGTHQLRIIRLENTNILSLSLLFVRQKELEQFLVFSFFFFF